MDVPGDRGSRSRGWWLAAGALVFLLAILFQGSRGLWEPDEGYYANAALAMARGGSLWLPLLNGHPFLDKPPLQYWAMAAGVQLLGRNEWGLRLANSLWFGSTALLAGALSGRLWGNR